MKIAAIQSRYGSFSRYQQLIRETKKETDCDVIVLPELFQDIYFCKIQNPIYLEKATTLSENKEFVLYQKLANELDVVIPFSWYERTDNVNFNSVAMINSDGRVLGIYRKSHIPDGLGYQEKYYFAPGDTGFRVFKTNKGNVGVGICWDQWFPEQARQLTLMGADVIVYPTAIGSEPIDNMYDSSNHWMNTMKGHSAANMIPIVACNRIGKETDTFMSTTVETTFYGNSFITDIFGNISVQMSDKEGYIYSTIDINKNRKYRKSWGLFRDRRIDLYDINHL